MNNNTCHRCGKLLQTNQFKFCSRSCSNSTHNHTRKRNDESKQRTAKTLSEFHATHPGFNSRTSLVPHPRRKTRRQAICSFCQKPFTSIRGEKERWPTICSNGCFIEVKRQNARGNKHLYYNGLRFDSQWEIDIAQYLDSRNIQWIRPDAIFWNDESGKQHRYYSDFFLPQYNIYLDPKNPIAILKQQKKLTIVEQLIPLVYGNLETIKKYVDRLSEIASEIPSS